MKRSQVRTLGLVVEDDVSAKVLHILDLLVGAGRRDDLETLLLRYLNNSPAPNVRILMTVS
jgi:hypothetical protein